MLTANSRVAILLKGGVKGHHGKTGLAFLRYSQTNIVAVIDPESVGESIAKLTGIERDVAACILQRWLQAGERRAVDLGEHLRPPFLGRNDVQRDVEVGLHGEEVSHRQLSGSADIHGAQQGDIGGHACALSSSLR